MDRYGCPIRREDYEDEGFRIGWFIGLVDPEEREFPPSLRPVGLSPLSDPVETYLHCRFLGQAG